MIHCPQCIERDTIPDGRKKIGAGCTPQNFNEKMPILKNKALL